MTGCVMGWRVVAAAYLLRGAGKAQDPCSRMGGSEKGVYGRAEGRAPQIWEGVGGSGKRSWLGSKASRKDLCGRVPKVRAWISQKSLRGYLCNTGGQVSKGSVRQAATGWKGSPEELYATVEGICRKSCAARWNGVSGRTVRHGGGDLQKRGGRASGGAAARWKGSPKEICLLKSCAAGTENRCGAGLNTIWQEPTESGGVFCVCGRELEIWRSLVQSRDCQFSGSGDAANG
uniref:Uncharacterized protein n=1 Tax=Chromera velia CCMP2878 TaxID=1169474 RepID=A0A0G4I840_9ALVE|eukprot:Cvel_11826.t1-p1 / transcript=Cvel_11826.t1 / gene=Cvel_11826 / organism=Chromera_velia_CCMP2878 / gene_product=hypothetical protein / transcript_product=hypothetical protein / location=Cvel_scaffold753:51380-52427(+) / protein_length=231 / sequence_SO=supercontig / SO=protein_coding / is_pseudo=false